MTVHGKKADAKVMVVVDGPVIKADGDHLLIRGDRDTGQWVRLEVQESVRCFSGTESGRRFWCEVGKVQCVRVTSTVGRTGLYRASGLVLERGRAR